MEEASELIECLTALGLTQAEAATYIHLHVMGQAGAPELTAALGTDRNRVYRTLQKLAERGIVVQTMARPVRFRAIDPEVLFDELERAQRAQLRDVANARRETVPLLRSLGASSDVSGAASFKLLHGRAPIAKAIDRMIARAAIEVKVATTGSAQAWRPRANRSRAPVRLLLPIGASATARGLDARHVHTERAVRCVIVDDREFILGVVNDPTALGTAPHEVAVWSNAPGFLDAQLALWDALWQSASAPPGYAEAGDSLSVHP